jgi:hypothetical protein
MRRSDLTWYRLRFPRDLEESAVLAALSAFSGVSSSTRLVFDLSASREGIEHHLAVNSAAVETVLGSLRAAIPSLRLDQVEAPNHRHDQRALWQVTPPTAVIRTDGLSAIAADLLASLFPLSERETRSRLSSRVNSPWCSSACCGSYAAITSSALTVRCGAGSSRSWRRSRSISATVLGFIFTPRQPRLESSSTAQMSERADVSPGKRPMTLVRLRTSTNVLSRRFVVLIRLRCSNGNRRWATRAGRSVSMTAIAEG